MVWSEGVDADLLWDFAAVAFCLVHEDGTIVRANPAFERLVGAGPEALTGLDVTHFIHPDERDEHRLRRSEVARTGFRTAGFDRRVVRLDGEIRTIRLSALPVRTSPTGDPLLVLQFDDTELREARAALEHAARHDPLTGLPNRAVVFDLLDKDLARSTLDGDRLGLLFCDLDGFKAINDRHGHAVGDAVLVEVARRLRAAVRPSDTVARIGGDEFLVLARELDGPDAGPLLAARVREAVARPITVGSVVLTLRVSIGVAVGTGIERGSAALVEAADADMYRDKRAHATIVLPADLDERRRATR